MRIRFLYIVALYSRISGTRKCSKEMRQGDKVKGLFGLRKVVLKEPGHSATLSKNTSSQEVS